MPRRKAHAVTLDLPADLSPDEADSLIADFVGDAPPPPPVAKPRRGGRGRSPAAKPDEYATVFAAGLVLLSLFAAWGSASPALVMSDGEAAAIAAPAARIFARTELARRFGKHLASSNDYIALGWALFRYGARVAQHGGVGNGPVGPVRPDQPASEPERPDRAPTNGRHAVPDFGTLAGAGVGAFRPGLPDLSAGGGD